MNIDKDNLRKEYLKIRKNILAKDIKSHIITKKIIDTNEYHTAKVIAIYNNLTQEVSTKELIKYSLNHNKIVLLPRVNNNEMIFYKITTLNDFFIKSPFGIQEPLPIKENQINSDKIDLMIIPGVCFDKEKNRLGFGKGYYDKYLENTNIKKIGICFEDQVLRDKIIPTDKYDIKMDIVITEKKISL